MVGDVADLLLLLPLLTPVAGDPVTVLVPGFSLACDGDDDDVF